MNDLRYIFHGCHITHQNLKIFILQFPGRFKEIECNNRLIIIEGNNRYEGVRCRHFLILLYKDNPAVESGIIL